MHTVDLSFNKLVLFISCLASLFFLFLSNFELALLQPLRFLGFAGLFLTGLVLYLEQSNKLFVHIDKAGISYGLIFQTKYIHQESIQAVTKKPGIFGSVLQVSITGDKVKRFYCWQLRDDEFAKSERLLSL